MMSRIRFALAFLAAVLFLANAATDTIGQQPGRQKERTSEDTPQLKRVLERHPEADLDGDGVLTLDEARQARRKMQAERQNRDRRPNQANRGRASASATRADVSYGDHQRNVLDFWQAESDSPTPLFIWIHGGGFRGGDKRSFPGELRRRCLEAGISCAAINYRLSSHAPYPAQMHDSARAVQFLRSKAEAWNLDPTKFAAGGGSAGSGISQWLGYHADLADPDSDDPIARQSTRLACVIPLNMQSTYDPRVIKEIIPGKAYTHPALVPFFGRPDGWDWDEDPVDDSLDELLKDASPITHLSEDDPPIFLLQYARAATPGNIHHPKFGEHLKQAADRIGVRCVAKLDSDFESMSDAYAAMVEFMKSCFEK